MLFNMFIIRATRRAGIQMSNTYFNAIGYIDIAMAEIGDNLQRLLHKVNTTAKNLNIINNTEE